jgi:hypothetical protein
LAAGYPHLDVDVQRIGDVSDGVQLHVVTLSVQQPRDDRGLHANSACELGLEKLAARTDLVEDVEQLALGTDDYPVGPICSAGRDFGSSQPRSSKWIAAMSGFAP